MFNNSPWIARKTSWSCATIHELNKKLEKNIHFFVDNPNLYGAQKKRNFELCNVIGMNFFRFGTANLFISNRKQR